MHYLGPLLFTVLAALAIAAAWILRSGLHTSLAAITAELARRGIRYSGLGAQGLPTPATLDALEFPARGIVLERHDGVRASLSPNSTQGAATLPGFGPVHPQQTLVELELALPDQMICAHDRAQAVFGPFPPPAQRTGNPEFDQRFGIFMRPAEAQGYRPSPSDPAPWARSPAAGALFADFTTLGFVALHVHAGRARMLFAPQPVDGLVAALDAGGALARPHEARPPARPPSRLGSNSRWVLILWVTFLPTGIMMPLLPHLTETGLEIAGSSLACPRGGTFQKGYRQHSDTCKQANGTTYRAEMIAYKAWQFALWTPFFLGLTAANAALHFKSRRDAARAVLRGLGR